jgi:hypothetical protein
LPASPLPRAPPQPPLRGAGRSATRGEAVVVARGSAAAHTEIPKLLQVPDIVTTEIARRAGGDIADVKGRAHVNWMTRPLQVSISRAETAADASGAPQIEVTVQMIEAGAEAIFAYREFYSAWDSAEKVYRAMGQARLSRGRVPIRPAAPSR